ncbi:Hypothetical predicted protein, partial [Paramuricea clavata]
MAVSLVMISSATKLMLAAVFFVFVALNINIPLATSDGCFPVVLKLEDEKSNANLTYCDCCMLNATNGVMYRNVTRARAMAIDIAIYESEWVSSTNVYCTEAESSREWDFINVNLVCELSIPNFYFATTYYNAETCVQWLTARQKHKIKWSQSRIPYYVNSIAGFQIILSGDVESNPGPNRSNASKSSR